MEKKIEIYRFCKERHQHEMENRETKTSVIQNLNTKHKFRKERVD